MAKKKLYMVFKCTRCESEVVREPDEIVKNILNMRKLMQEETDYEWEGPNKKVNSIYHQCDDEMYGIAELVGFDLKKE